MERLDSSDSPLLSRALRDDNNILIFNLILILFGVFLKPSPDPSFGNTDDQSACAT